jgi:microcystin-dependent protein
MPRASSGIYVRPASDVNPKVATQVIDPVALDNEQNDIASEITNSLDRLGRAAMLAILNMGGFRISNVASPVGPNDAARIMDFGMYLPPGALQLFAMQVAPAGWLVCDGSAVSRTTFANLFAAIGTLYGVGDGSTTFNVPDARGRFARVWDNGAGLDPARVFGSVQADMFAAHTHLQNAHTHLTTESPHVHSVGPSGVTLNVSAGGVAGTQPGGGVTGGAVTGLTINSATAVNQNAGGAETAPKNIAFQLCIRT